MESAIRYTVILRRKAKISICPKMEHSFLSATFVWETGPTGLGEWIEVHLARASSKLGI